MSEPVPHGAPTSGAPGTNRSAVRFLLLWFAMPLVLIVVYQVLASRSR